MIGKNRGLIALIKKEISACGSLQQMQYYFIIYQENIFLKSVGFQTIMIDVVKIVDLIRSRGFDS